MDFDWQTPPFDPGVIGVKDIEETFEDPFNLKFLPEEGKAARFYLLGRSLGGKSIFSVFRTDGRRVRVIFARLMTGEESVFYDRKNAEALI